MWTCWPTTEPLGRDGLALISFPKRSECQGNKLPHRIGIIIMVSGKYSFYYSDLLGFYSAGLRDVVDKRDTMPSHDDDDAARQLLHLSAWWL